MKQHPTNWTTPVRARIHLIDKNEPITFLFPQKHSFLTATIYRWLRHGCAGPLGIWGCVSWVQLPLVTSTSFTFPGALVRYHHAQASYWTNITSLRHVKLSSRVNFFSPIRVTKKKKKESNLLERSWKTGFCEWECYLKPPWRAIEQHLSKVSTLLDPCIPLLGFYP